MQVPSHRIMTESESENPVYAGIKAMVMAHELVPGQRIRLEPLADRLFVSNTPVREALIHLAAERLIKEVPNAGFFTKEISETEIRNLYILNQLILDWSLRVVRNDGRVPGMLKPPEIFETASGVKTDAPVPTVQMMDELFRHISRQSGNDDIVHVVGNIGERTYYTRLKECELCPEVPESLARLCRTYYRRDTKGLRQGLQDFHDMRLQMLPDVIRRIRQIKQDAPCPAVPKRI